MSNKVIEDHQKITKQKTNINKATAYSSFLDIDSGEISSSGSTPSSGRRLKNINTINSSAKPQ